MRNYFDTILNEATGEPLIGAQVRVWGQDGFASPVTITGLATIYSDANGTVTDNPVTVQDNTTSSPGFFQFYADDAFYTLEYLYGGAVIWTVHNVDISADATAAQLADDTGATLIGTATGETLAVRLAAFAAFIVSLAASAGAALVGYIQSGTGAVATTIQNRLRRTVYAEDFGFTPGGNATANTTALQAAFDASSSVILPRSATACTFDGQITFPANARLIGHGPTLSRLSCTYASGFAFKHHTATDGGANDTPGPGFRGFSLACAHSGIQLNNPAADFDGASAQSSLMRPYFEDVWLDGPTNASVPTSVGLDLSKCFNAQIAGCEIEEFGTGLRSKGSDLCALLPGTRIWACGTLIDISKSGTWGSGWLILGADLLSAADYFIRSADWDLRLLYNYLENTTALSEAVLDITHDYRTQIIGNRIECPATDCPELMRVTGDGQLFAFEKNGTSGEAWGTVTWNTDNSAKYWKNTIHRQQIIQRDNSDMEAFPFQTGPAANHPRNRFRDLWQFTPNNKGLLTLNYGDDLEVRDGAFVIPAINDAGHLARFRDADYPVTGFVNILARVKGTVSGQEFLCYRMDDGGSTFVASTGALATTTSYVWYTLFRNVEVDDLELEFTNIDTGNGGEILITDIVVEQTDILTASKTMDWADLATATTQSTTVTVTGAAAGDLVEGVSMSTALSGTYLWGEVTAADTVTVYHRNDTGGNVNVASGTLSVKVRRA